MCMTGSASILVVDDEPAIRELIRAALRKGGFNCIEASTVAEARDAIIAAPPELILLDWMLPGRSGLEFASELRQDTLTRGIPIIMITARTEELDKVRGLNTGADDYITKPFSPLELLARIRAVLRRTAPAHSGEAVEFEGLRMDPNSPRVTAAEHPVKLGPTEFRMLQYFMNHPERVTSRGQLIDNVWGSNAYVEDRTVDVHVRRLRAALEPSGHDRLIQTVRGAGYRFSTQR
jgi:two-component system phosphate regulon response regulator PhoB